MPAPTDYELFDLDLALQNSGTPRAAKPAYKAYGTLNDDKSNVILHPTWFSAWHDANEWTIEPGLACDPGRYFILVPNQINNGLSSSPSNTPPPFDGSYCRRSSSTTRWRRSTGCSRRSGASSRWNSSWEPRWAPARPTSGRSATRRWSSVRRPSSGRRGPASTNQVFLESLRAALTLDPAFADGHYSPDTPPTRGLRAFARIYAGWGLSQAFYWQREYRTMGYSSLEDFLVGFWEGFWLDGREPNNLLAMLWTWEHGDVGKTPEFDGDGEAALRSIRCPVVSMPARTDLYFPPEDEEA